MMRHIGRLERLDLFCRQLERERCHRVNLGYLNPAEIRLEDWENRQDEDIHIIHRAGETLYRLKNASDR